jgi:hypothetical protein
VPLALFGRLRRGLADQPADSFERLRAPVVHRLPFEKFVQLEPLWPVMELQLIKVIG